MLKFFTLCFNLSVVFCLFFLVESSNILFSVLILILVALMFSLYIISFSSVFIGLLYLAVYVGAVTVFILFVVMMTDLSLGPEVLALTQKRSSTYILKTLDFFGFSILDACITFSFAILLVSLLEYGVTIIHQNVNNHILSFSTLDSSDNQTMQIALDLLNQHLAPFLVLGLVILLSLIGSIFIVTQGNQKIPSVGLAAYFEIGESSPISKSQNMDLQLLAESKNTIKLNLF